MKIGSINIVPRQNVMVQIKLALNYFVRIIAHVVAIASTGVFAHVHFIIQGLTTDHEAKTENRTRSFCPSNSYTKFLKSYGTLESVFCQGGHFYNTICTRNVETNALDWVSDKHCKQSLRKKFSLDDNGWLLSTIIFTFFAVQFALYIFISYCFDTPGGRALSLVFYISKYIVQMFNFNPSQKSEETL